MLYYRIADVTLRSEIILPSFETFITEAADADISLALSEESVPQGVEVRSSYIVQHKIAEGWFYHAVFDDQMGLAVSEDYKSLKLIGHMSYVDRTDKNRNYNKASLLEESLVRMALECLLVRRGYVSLHSACIELDGEAYAFSGPSGTGKSTRASAWMKAFSNAELISGDRPLIDVRNLEVYGVPWDGKEQCYRNVHHPLKAVFEVRRMETETVYIREMSFEQKRKLLMRQCFLPMWDTETAVIQMMNIAKLASSANILRIFCGPTPEDAVALKTVFDNNQYKKEEPDMKAKSGFVLRNIVGEQILMPVGDNIGKFKGTVLLNEVSAFVWNKLQNPMSRDDLLAAILNEFDVEESVAAADLNALLAKFEEYGVIDKD